VTVRVVLLDPHRAQDDHTAEQPSAQAGYSISISIIPKSCESIQDDSPTRSADMASHATPKGDNVQINSDQQHKVRDEVANEPVTSTPTKRFES
jgi:hypothetical protein